MNQAKRKKLEKAGWKVGSAGEFLELTPEEEVLVDIKLALAAELKDRRKKRRMTQTALGELVGSSQSRVAKMEAADGSVSVDLLVRSLAALGASQKDIGAVLGKTSRTPTGRKRELATAK